MKDCYPLWMVIVPAAISAVLALLLGWSRGSIKLYRERLATYALHDFDKMRKSGIPMKGFR